MTTYKIQGMRVLLPKNRKNPNVALTVKGIFHDSAGNKLSIRSKDILKSQTNANGFSVDMAKGILTLAAGQRGKPTTKGVTQAQLDSYLTSLKAK